MVPTETVILRNISATTRVIPATAMRVTVSAVGNVNSVEWNDGMERWSGLLEWSTGLDYWSATPTKLFIIIHVHCSMASHLEKQLKNKSKVVWGAMPNPGTRTRSKVKKISPAK